MIYETPVCALWTASPTSSFWSCWLSWPLASALTFEIAHTSARRTAETELLAIGKEFERAFASYCRQGAAGGPRFPGSLDDLTRDPRVLGIRRHLRRVYVDPLTRGAWGTVSAPGGGIMAVYSTSEDQPFQRTSARWSRYLSPRSPLMRARPTVTATGVLAMTRDTVADCSTKPLTR